MPLPNQQLAGRNRHGFMMLRLMLCLLLGCGLGLAQEVNTNGPEFAKKLAEHAQRAREAGETVLAYQLFVEAAKRDPSNTSYAAGRDQLAAPANLLLRTHLDKGAMDSDMAAAEREFRAEAEQKYAEAHPGELELKRSLESFPHVQVKDGKHDFDLHGDEIALIKQVSAAYGVRASWDPQLDVKSNLTFRVTQADFRSAMEALTIATNTFVFAISPNTLYFARDSEAKRNELEPVILLTVPLPESMSDKDLVDVANAVRGVLNLRSFGWDSLTRTVFIRDRATRAMAARSLMQALLLPKAEVQIDVEVLTFDDSVNYHYGISPPSSFSLIDFAPFNLLGIAGSIGSFTRFFTFGRGNTMLGLTTGSASLFASYSKSVAKTTYEASMMTLDGSAANFHFGEKYPIAQSLYTGFNAAGSSSSGSIYQPVPQITQEDLGLVLKITPRVTGSGEVGLDVEAEYKTLGAVVLNTVPSVDQRKFTGNVTLKEGEWALLAGLDEKSINATRNGWPGFSNIPILNQILSENQKSHSDSQTMVLIKPIVTRLPMSADISPQYLLGPQRGVKVLL